ncbi:BTAD domain-containing putative transcriptional regulator [Saccharothrix mutabilis subsp. capreolus]|uniref:AfsR/SARP family transcriptional regulator n=1 Tax=Saccharothrix mutabilis TaxID=33921 RepID=UPI0035E65494|nr:BTAD domain-containing putative transcriptional regulator [Saccharothrix mutabilis subsp. capreolus]
MAGRVECRLLGPVEVVVDGVAAPLGGAKPRVLLAALLLEHGRVVPTDRLIDVIWPEDPPDTARAVIQTYVKTLRQSLARHGVTDLIVTSPPGYLARVPAGALDLVEFERLLARGRAAGSADDTAAVLRSALALWRGPALAGVGASLLAGEAARLEELRLAATEELVSADLAAGRYEVALPEVTALLRRFPTHEGLRARHMTALHRLGRRSEALASFREARAALAEELGLDPGPELTAAHEAVLRGDPDPSPRAGSERTPVPAPRPPVPTQLPLVPADFTGRSREIAALVRELAPRDGSWSPPIRVLSGKGGSGKSALAARVATELAAAFPDGQLHAELRGMTDAPADPAEVLSRFLKALGCAPDAIPETLDERVETYRRLVADRTVLVVLDDAASSRQVLPLVPGGGRCAVLVTSRDRLAGLPGASRVELEVLGDDEAVELLTRIVGPARADAEPQAVADIVERCGRMPLAIRVAGARLTTRQRWPLQLLADRLADERRRLDELSVADLEVRASFRLSYRSLAPDERRTLGRLGFLGVPEFAPWVVAWLLDVDTRAAENVIERLVDAHLVDFSRVDDQGFMRYRLHDLVRIHGREEAESAEPEADLVAAVARVLGGWLSVVDQVAGVSPPEEMQWPRTAVPAPVSPLVVTDPQTWFDTEQPAIVVGVERGAALALYDLVRRFAATRLGPSLFGVDRFEARERINAAALEATRRAGDRRGEAMMLTELGQLRYLQDEFPESLRLHTEALAVFRELDDPACEAVVLAGLGTTCREAGRLAEALEHLDAARALVRRLGDRSGMAYVARLSGSVRLERGEPDRAWDDLVEALAAYREVGSLRGEALVLRTIGLYHRAVGAYLDSVAVCAEAAGVFRGLGDRLMESYAVRSLVKAEARLGREVEDPRLQWCLSVCRSMGDRWGEAATLRTIGEVHLARGRLAEAETALLAAVALWDELRVPLWRARTERDLASVHRARGDLARADELAGRVAEVFRAHGVRA